MLKRISSIIAFLDARRNYNQRQVRQHENLNNHARKLLTYSRTKANAKAWLRGLLRHPDRYLISYTGTAWARSQACRLASCITIINTDIDNKEARMLPRKSICYDEKTSENNLSKTTIIRRRQQSWILDKSQHGVVTTEWRSADYSLSLELHDKQFGF